MILGTLRAGPGAYRVTRRIRTPTFPGGPWLSNRKNTIVTGSGCRSFIALDPHAENGGLGRNKRSTRRRISANRARGTATRVSCNTTQGP